MKVEHQFIFMNSVDESCRECTSHGFFFVEISDLAASSVVGGALAGVNATAYASGTPSLALTRTHTTARQFACGGSLAMGWGTAVAIGNNPVTNVSVFGAGNVVVGHTTTTNSSTQTNYTHTNLSVSTGSIFVFDYP